MASTAAGKQRIPKVAKVKSALDPSASLDAKLTAVAVRAP